MRMDKKAVVTNRMLGEVSVFCIVWNAFGRPVFLRLTTPFLITRYFIVQM